VASSNTGLGEGDTETLIDDEILGDLDGLKDDDKLGKIMFQ